MAPGRDGSRRPIGLFEAFFPLRVRHLAWYAGVIAVALGITASVSSSSRLRLLEELLLIELCAGLAWLLLRAGRATAAAVVAVVGSWLIAAGVALLTGGVSALSYAGFTVVILLAALLTGVGGAAVAAMATLILGLAAPATAGLAPTAPPVLRVAMVFTFLIVFLATAQREMREANWRTAASLSLVQATLDSTADGILVVDMAGRVAGHNQKFLELWRIPPALAKAGDDGPLLASVVDQLRDPGAFLAKVRELYDHPDAVSFDALEFTDGRVFERYSQPQRLGGRTIGRVWSFRDVTEARRGEATRRRLEQELFQAQKLEALGRLAGGIAHDFNNILTAIVSYAEVARLDSEDRPPVVENLDAVVQASLRARDLVTQILTFSRARADARAPLNLAATVGETLRLLRTTLPREVQVIFERPAEEFPVLANPTQIHQVVMNLGVNAGQAIGARGGRVLVRLEPVEVSGDEAAGPPGVPAGKYMLLEVGDSGPGMDAATQARIFEPFFSTKAPGKGTGLGLSVVHGIVQDHGGSITVSSSPGTGTSFRVYFPRSEDVASR